MQVLWRGKELFALSHSSYYNLALSEMVRRRVVGSRKDVKAKTFSSQRHATQPVNRTLQAGQPSSLLSSSCICPSLVLSGSRVTTALKDTLIRGSIWFIWCEGGT